MGCADADADFTPAWQAGPPDAFRRVIPHLRCKTSLRRACKRLGIPNLSHHDFRRLFATRVIESGVDLPTAAKWMGHQDGGALLGRTYFHLADAHAREMAGQVEIDV